MFKIITTEWWRNWRSGPIGSYSSWDSSWPWPPLWPATRMSTYRNCSNWSDWRGNSLHLNPRWCLQLLSAPPLWARSSVLYLSFRSFSLQSIGQSLWLERSYDQMLHCHHFSYLCAIDRTERYFSIPQSTYLWSYCWHSGQHPSSVPQLTCPCFCFREDRVHESAFDLLWGYHGLCSWFFDKSG